MKVLVTGVSSGFGRAIARALAQDGHEVYGTVRKDKFCPFLQTGKDIALSGNELLVLIYNTPMTVNILSIPIPVNRIWMSGCVHIPSVLMDGYPIDTFIFCWT